MKQGRALTREEKIYLGKLGFNSADYRVTKITKMYKVYTNKVTKKSMQIPRVGNVIAYVEKEQAARHAYQEGKNA